MALLFLDTSAVIKVYVNELGSSWMRASVQPSAGHSIYLARITGVEGVSAIARRIRSGHLSPASGTLSLSSFRYDFVHAYRPVDVTASLVNRAMLIAQTHALRGYDAVQLAAALEVNAGMINAGQAPITLISSDTELNSAATAEGLLVDDPNTHP